MACWTDKVKTRMDPLVELVASIRLLLLTHVRLVLIINEVDNRVPGLFVVDIVAKARRVNDRQLYFESLFFQFGFDNVNFGRLVNLFCMAARVVLVHSEFRREQGVDEGRLFGSVRIDNRTILRQQEICTLPRPLSPQTMSVK